MAAGLRPSAPAGYGGFRPKGHLARDCRLPDVDARHQGGLLDVLVADDSATTRRVWWSYAEPRGHGTNATAVATGTLSVNGAAMADVQVIFQ